MSPQVRSRNRTDSTRELKNARSRKARGTSLHSLELRSEPMGVRSPTFSIASSNGMGLVNSTPSVRAQEGNLRSEFGSLLFAYPPGLGWRSEHRILQFDLATLALEVLENQQQAVSAGR